MKKYGVILINRDMNYSCPPRQIQGMYGKSLGSSRWNPQYGCHTSELLTVEAYNAAADDLAKAFHIAMRRWQARFVEIEVPDTVTESSSGTGPVKTVVAEAKVPVVDNGQSGPQQYNENDLCEMHHMTREKIARQFGLNPEEYRGRATEMVTAIMEKQAVHA